MPAEDAGLALVTGAAGSIGRATVHALSKRGMAVVTADREPLGEREAGLVADELRVDLCDDGAVGRLVPRLEKHGALRHVVTVAGGGDADELSQMDAVTEEVETFRRVLDNNLTSAFVTIRHVTPLLRRHDGNRSITLIGSINSLGGYGAPGYSAAKAGLVGLAKALAGPLGADGIRINCLALGTVDTEHLHELARLGGRALNLDAVAARAPLRRVLTPEEVADAVVAMALEMPGLTGATIVLDNGQHLIR